MSVVSVEPVPVKTLEGLYQLYVPPLGAPDAVNVSAPGPNRVFPTTVGTVDGFWLNLIITLSDVGKQGLLFIVHLNVYIDPATPLKLEIELDGLVIMPPTADPGTMLHVPVPAVGMGALPAKLMLVNPHVVAPV